MKKITLSIILSLATTFMFAEVFSLYHFGDVPTLLTAFYLILLFSIFEYLLISITYIIRKLTKKEKIVFNKVVGLILLFIALLLILLFLIIVDIDWLNWYAYSSPFYLNIIIRSLEFLLPAITLIVVSIFLLRCNK